ncbi:MAG: TolC family protein [Bacteroidota bacterium]|nr:TolC family protein [Bacteroidota bacterium]
MKKLKILMLFILLSLAVQAQDFITIDTCYNRLEKNYPTMKNPALISEAVSIKMKSLNTNYLPQLNIGGQATWQSDVTKLEIDNPMFDFETPDISKDQYKLYAELSQVIWDGGATSVAKEIEDIAGRIEKQQIYVDLYALRQQVNALYFSVLMLQEQINVFEIQKAGIEDKLKEIRVAVENDMILPASEKELEVTKMSIEQQIYEAEQTRKTALLMLELLTGSEIPELTQFLLPACDLSLQKGIGRPEIDAFALQKQRLEVQKEMLTTQRYPQFAAFGQAGYGRPGLNMLSDDFEPFAIVGVKFSWSPWHWNNIQHKKQMLDLSVQQLNNKEEAFRQSIQTQAEQYLNDVHVNEEMMSRDEAIIGLRSDIRETKESQFVQGSITASEYLEAVNQETAAKVQQEIHRIKKSKAIIQYLTVTGKNKDNYESNE